MYIVVLTHRTRGQRVNVYNGFGIIKIPTARTRGIEGKPYSYVLIREALGPTETEMLPFLKHKNVNSLC
jgi:hypothetical protein